MFRDMSALPTKRKLSDIDTDADDGRVTAEIPMGGGDSLAHLLKLINYFLAGDEEPPALRERLLPEVLDIALTFDFPAVKQHVIRRYSLDQASDPFVLYLLATKAGDRNLIVEAGRRSLKLPITGMHKWVSTELKQVNPLRLIALYELHAQYPQRLERLRKSLIGAQWPTLQIPVDEDNPYEVEYVPEVCPMGTLCPTGRRDQVKAQAVQEMMRLLDGSTSKFSVALDRALDRTISCGSCRSLYNTMLGSVQWSYGGSWDPKYNIVEDP
jgi:hypothetical protein